MFVQEKLTSLMAENELLQYHITQSLIKRLEASRNAAKLAEDNYYLEENLKETRNEVKMLIRKNEFLLSQCEKSSHEKD